MGSSVVWYGEHTHEKVPFLGVCFDCEKVLVIGVCFKKLLAVGVDVMTQVCLVYEKVLVIDASVEEVLVAKLSKIGWVCSW